MSESLEPSRMHVLSFADFKEKRSDPEVPFTTAYDYASEKSPSDPIPLIKFLAEAVRSDLLELDYDPDDFVDCEPDKMDECDADKIAVYEPDNLDKFWTAVETTTFPENLKIGLIGPHGAGKSDVVRALLHSQLLKTCPVPFLKDHMVVPTTFTSPTQPETSGWQFKATLVTDEDITELVEHFENALGEHYNENDTQGFYEKAKDFLTQLQSITADGKQLTTPQVEAYLTKEAIDDGAFRAIFLQWATKSRETLVNTTGTEFHGKVGGMKLWRAGRYVNEKHPMSATSLVKNIEVSFEAKILNNLDLVVLPDLDNPQDMDSGVAPKIMSDLDYHLIVHSDESEVSQEQLNEWIRHSISMVGMQRVLVVSLPSTVVAEYMSSIDNDTRIPFPTIKQYKADALAQYQALVALPNPTVAENDEASILGQYDTYLKCVAARSAFLKYKAVEFKNSLQEEFKSSDSEDKVAVFSVFPRDYWKGVDPSAWEDLLVLDAVESGIPELREFLMTRVMAANYAAIEKKVLEVVPAFLKKD